MAFLGIGSGPQVNTNQAQGYMGTLSTLANEAGSGYNAAQNQFAGNNAGWQKALNQYSNYLSTNPATQQFNATQVANAEAGANEGAERATANTESNLAQRGISTNSGIAAGALANVQEGLAANNANVQNQVGQANIARYGQNMANLAGLWNGAANTSFSQANTLGNDAARDNQDLYGDSLQLANINYQNQQNKANQQAALYGTLAKTLAGAFGGPAGAATAASATSNLPGLSGGTGWTPGSGNTGQTSNFQNPDGSINVYGVG